MTTEGDPMPELTGYPDADLMSKRIAFDLAADFRQGGQLPYDLDDEQYEAFVAAVLPAFEAAAAAHDVEIIESNDARDEHEARSDWDDVEDYIETWQAIHDEADVDMAAALAATGISQ